MKRRRSSGDSCRRNVCSKCRHNFESEDRLKEHLLIHDPRFCGLCGYKPSARLNQTSAVILHLESGKCKVDMLHLERIIMAFPERDTFTVDGLRENFRIIGNHRRRERSASPHRSHTYGEYYRCRICRKSFRRREDLDQHLESPAHAPQVFRCPGDKCGTRFPLLSALFQHAENSNGCREGLNCGTGCLGRLWVFMDEELRRIERAGRSYNSAFRGDENKPSNGMSKANLADLGAKKAAITSDPGAKDLSSVPVLPTSAPSQPYMANRTDNHVIPALRREPNPMLKREHGALLNHQVTTNESDRWDRGRETLRYAPQLPKAAAISEVADSPPQMIEQIIAAEEGGTEDTRPSALYGERSTSSIPISKASGTPFNNSGKVIAATPSSRTQYVVNGSGRLEEWTGAPSQANLPVFSLIGISAPVDSLLPQEFDFMTTYDP